MAAAGAVPVEAGDTSGDLLPGASPPGQQQMSGPGVQPPGLSSVAPSIEQLMAFLVQSQTQMADLMRTIAMDKKGGKEQLANARLEERNFRRIKVFSNKKE